MYRSINSVTLLLTVGLLVSCSPGPSEDEARSVIATLEDYQRAEQFLPPNANPLVTGRILLSTGRQAIGWSIANLWRVDQRF